MAKYGFKEGQGLGKQEQGMSMALQVEKTSKRGGRIIHEKEILPQPAPATDPNATEPSITEIMKSPSKVCIIFFLKANIKLLNRFILKFCKDLTYRLETKKFCTLISCFHVDRLFY